MADHFLLMYDSCTLFLLTFSQRINSLKHLTFYIFTYFLWLSLPPLFFTFLSFDLSCCDNVHITDQRVYNGLTFFGDTKVVHDHNENKTVYNANWWIHAMSLVFCLHVWFSWAFFLTWKHDQECNYEYNYKEHRLYSRNVNNYACDNLSMSLVSVTTVSETKSMITSWTMRSTNPVHG